MEVLLSGSSRWWVSRNHLRWQASEFAVDFVPEQIQPVLSVRRDLPFEVLANWLKGPDRCYLRKALDQLEGQEFLDEILFGLAGGFRK